MQDEIKYITDETKKRRTFAIISHPDAGKTTITEKLLLYGGAIRLAGAVKSRKADRYAISDWMEIEKQRGISVTSSVLQFDYDGYCVNILDTPGHQDFSEDTYRTLMAADSAVMLLDGAKGVEAQTIKLFHVCRMRRIPIFTFINKMDRASKDPFDLMNELENVLGIRSFPINWPIGTEGDFKGVYDRRQKTVELYEGGTHGRKAVKISSGKLDDSEFVKILGEHYRKKLADDIELLDIAGDRFDLQQVIDGELTPIFFGSAITNFGVEPFLKQFIKMSPSPGPRMSANGYVDPIADKFSGFVFKIQANMNPLHRDRIAFMRIVSGRFEKGMSVFHSGTGKEIRLSQPQQFMAQDRIITEEAFPGDIVGLFDTGILKIGDTLTADKEIKYEGIPLFPSEHFAKIYAPDSMKRKQFLKGINQLSEEGAIQVYKQVDIGVEELVIGAVGALQFEVLEYRLKGEYGVDIRLQKLPYRFARWLAGETVDLNKLNLTSSTLKARDMCGRYVLLFENEWSIKWAKDKNKGLELTDIAPTDI